MGTLEIIAVVLLGLLALVFMAMYHIRTKQVHTLSREVMKLQRDGDNLGVWQLACTRFKKFTVVSYGNHHWTVTATDHDGNTSRSIELPDAIIAILTVDRQLRAGE